MYIRPATSGAAMHIASCVKAGRGADFPQLPGMMGFLDSPSGDFIGGLGVRSVGLRGGGAALADGRIPAPRARFLLGHVRRLREDQRSSSPRSYRAFSALL